MKITLKKKSSLYSLIPYNFLFVLFMDVVTKDKSVKKFILCKKVLLLQFVWGVRWIIAYYWKSMKNYVQNYKRFGFFFYKTFDSNVVVALNYSLESLFRVSFKHNILLSTRHLSFLISWRRLLNDFVFSNKTVKRQVLTLTILSNIKQPVSLDIL